MKDSNISLRQIAMDRLTEIGLHPIPTAALTLVVDTYSAAAQKSLGRLAKRTITVPKGTVLIREALAAEKGSRGKTEGLSLGEAGPTNEVRQGP